MQQKKTRGRPRKKYAVDVDEGNANAFARWLADNGIEPDWIATILDIHLSAVYRWRNGKQPPTQALALRISVMSNGAVPVSAWD